jgi:hypothetical protein
MNEELISTVQRLVRLLVAGKLDDVERLTKGNRLKAQEIKEAISTYGRHLVAPPADAFNSMELVKIRDSNPPRWSVVMPLWTREEGRSDLSIELTLIENQGTFQIELDDIHVL